MPSVFLNCHLRVELALLKAIAVIGIASFSRTLATRLSRCKSSLIRYNC